MTPRCVAQAPGVVEQMREVLGFELSEEQHRAVTAPLEPLAVIAGAGSGKTAVMGARVAYLVATGQVRAHQVLGLTFTNKAAAELGERVGRYLTRLGALRGVDLTVDGEPEVSTYHAYAGRLISEHGLRVGVEPRSRLLADASRFQLALRTLQRTGRQLEHLRLTLTTHVADLVGLEGELLDHRVSPAQLRDHHAALIARLDAVPDPAPEVLALRAVCLQRLELLGLVEEYRAAKRAAVALDFGDQVDVACRLAEGHPAVGEAERARSRVVLLDEYQDTSVAQRQLLTALFGSGHPVTAVGDPCQAIYGWRGASAGNLLGFPGHFPRADRTPAAVLPLQTSRRCAGRILDLANQGSKDLRGRLGVGELRSPPELADRGTLSVALLETVSEEVAWVAEQVADRVAGGTHPAEVAVLVRSRAPMAAVHAALIARGVPAEVVGLGGLLDVPEVADVVATLQVISDPTANHALVRLLTGPRFRLGVRDLAALGRQAKSLLRTRGPAAPEEPVARGLRQRLLLGAARADHSELVALSDALPRPGGSAAGWSERGLARATALAGELRELRLLADQPLIDLVHAVVDRSGLEIELASDPARHGAASAGLAAFFDVVAGFTDLDGEASLAAFLAYLEAAEDYDRGLDTSQPSGRDAVQILTVHKAKGLEWDVVVLPGLVKSVFPSTRLEGRVWTRTRDQLPHALRGDVGDVPPDPADVTSKAGLTDFADAMRDHVLLEEDRLVYVACTRARLEVIASGHRWGPTQVKAREPSPLLQSIAAAAAEHGQGPVHWAEAPKAGTTSPEREAGGAAVRWPADLDADAFCRRQDAAAAVRQAMAPVQAALFEVPAPAAVGLSEEERRWLAGVDADLDLLVAEARAADRPSRLVELPRTLSATQLERLVHDPGGLAADVARPLPRRPATRARRGTRFHAWVEERFGLRPLIEPDDLPGAEDDGEGTDAELAALQEAFLATEWATRAPHAVEAPFDLPLAGRVLRGRIDAVYQLPDGSFDVVDWKTGSETADPLQLAVYRLAWARLHGLDPDRVGAAFVYVASGRTVRPAPLATEAELTRLLTGSG